MNAKNAAIARRIISEAERYCAGLDDPAEAALRSVIAGERPEPRAAEGSAHGIVLHTTREGRSAVLPQLVSCRAHAWACTGNPRDAVAALAAIYALAGEIDFQKRAKLELALYNEETE